MATRDPKFSGRMFGKIDYDKIDRLVDAYLETLTPENAPPERSKLFLFSGGSACTVGPLVRGMGDEGLFDKKCSLVLDSETIAEMDVIRGLKHDARLMKHAEKLTQPEALRFNKRQKKLARQFAPNTASPHDVSYPLETSDGYVFSDMEGEIYAKTDGHAAAFRETLRYFTERVFEKAERLDVGASVVIDDHFEKVATPKALIGIAKKYGAETAYTVSFVEPKTALQRAEQRFNTEGEGKNIAFRIEPKRQIRTFFHQHTNWKILSRLVDTAILTEKNQDGPPPRIVEMVTKDNNGKCKTTTLDQQQRDTFAALDRMPKFPKEALQYLGFTGATHSRKEYPAFISTIATYGRHSRKPETLSAGIREVVEGRLWEERVKNTDDTPNTPKKR